MLCKWEHCVFMLCYKRQQCDEALSMFAVLLFFWLPRVEKCSTWKMFPYFQTPVENEDRFLWCSHALIQTDFWELLVFKKNTLKGTAHPKIKNTYFYNLYYDVNSSISYLLFGLKKSKSNNFPSVQLLISFQVDQHLKTSIFPFT